MSEIRSVTPRRLSTFWRSLLGLALLLSIGLILVVAVPYLLLNAEVVERFGNRRSWIFTHVLAGSVALLTGPFQIWMGATRRAGKLHRRLGMVYLFSIAISSATAFYLAITNEISWIYGMGLASLATAWVITTGLAYVSILRRDYLQHAEWMIRSYAVTFAFVVFRIFIVVTSALELGTFFERLEAASWFCWAVPLLVTEALIQGRKIFSRSLER